MSSELDTFEIMMYRSIIGLIVVLICGGICGSLVTVSRQRFGLQLIRNISHFSGQNLWFYAVAVIPFSQVFAFEFSSPIWVALMAPFFLGERLTRTRLFAVILGFLGIIIVAQPSSFTFGPGIAAAALCAVCFAGTIIATKQLAQTQSTTSILFWLVTMQLVFGILCSFYDGDVTLPSLATAPLVVLVGCAGLLAHFCITSALKLAPVMIIAPIDFLRLPIIAIIGASFYSEAVNLWVIIGAVIIFSANFFNIWSENRTKSPKAT